MFLAIRSIPLEPTAGLLVADARQRPARRDFASVRSAPPILICGYAYGLDMTQRDLQRVRREKRHRWDIGKDIESGAVVSEVVPMAGTILSQGRIALDVNGETRQDSDLPHLIWSIPELIVDLSKYYRLQPGDLVFTGTPAGVGPLQPGDHLEGHIDGVSTISLTIGPAE